MTELRPIDTFYTEAKPFYTPVNFEQFAKLNNSMSLLDRAAFWCYWAAWSDAPLQTEEQRAEVRGIAVAMTALSHDVWLTDVVATRKNYVFALQRHRERCIGTLISAVVIAAILFFSIGYTLGRML